MILAIDFDGTLHNAPYPSIGEPAPYAAETVRKLYNDGHYLIIWTCREGIRQTEAVNWLIENNIPFHRIKDHKPGTTEQYGYSARKVYAHVYIDDKNILGLPAWNVIYQEITQMEAEYRKKNE